ncbi:MAG: response regulator transcription factor [Clostridia bacterium]|nr:response regulator transcription factor [Clostridia bacterium]
MYLRVGICDDEPIQTEYVASIVHGWADVRGNRVETVAFSSAEAFLFEYAEDRSYDILFLDIEMDKMNGIELAKRIRTENEDVQIVFVTGYPDFIGEGYEVSALHYLMKPVGREKLYAVLDRAAAAREKGRRYLLLPDGKKLFRVAAEDLVYGESDGHYVLLHTEQDTHRLRMTVPELDHHLGEGFCRISRSFVVGLPHVRRIGKTGVVLDNGTELPLGRGMYDEVSQAFVKYLRGL